MDIVKRWRAALKEVTDLGGMELKNKLTVSANNKGKHSIGCLFWLLARMVLQMRSVINQGHKWEVMVDLFFYREPEESKGKQEEDAAVQNYADYSIAALGGTDQWPNQITDSKWNDKGISPAIPAVPGVTWTPDAAPIASDGWDGAVEPPMHVATGVDIIPPGFEEQGQKDEWNRRERVSDHKNTC